MKKFLGKILRKLLPLKIYKLVANGFIVVPKYFKPLVTETDLYMLYSSGNSDEKNIMLMRKYAHIIDKGLHRMDVSKGHSCQIARLLKDKIETVKGGKYKDDQTIGWAESKLDYYDKLQETTSPLQPLSGTNEDSSTTFEQLTQVIKSRRSNRHFLSKEIDNDTILLLKEIANWSANSCNKQAITIYHTNNPTLAKQCLSCCKGGTGFSDYIPSFFVFTADCRGYVWPSEIFLPHIDVSLGAQNFFLCAHTLGLSGTILSWAQKDLDEEQTLRQLLSIPKEHIIVFCAVLGYASNTTMTPLRKSVTI